MELQHVNVKIFVERLQAVDRATFIPIFHRWIQDKSCEELLIDVADYLHVDAGPGVVLVGHEADYSMDETGHRMGLRYNRKAKVEGDNTVRFKQALGAALLACQRLEEDPALEGKLKFNRSELTLFINDRALAPNTLKTYEAVKPELEKSFQSVFNGNKFTMTHDPDPKVRFSVMIKLSRPFDFKAVLNKSTEVYE